MISEAWHGSSGKTFITGQGKESNQTGSVNYTASISQGGSRKAGSSMRLWRAKFGKDLMKAVKGIFKAFALLRRLPSNFLFKKVGLLPGGGSSP